MKKIAILFSVLVFTTTVFAANNVLKDRADSLYTSGNFEEAANVYNEVLANGLESADLYYNLGNAYYKQGKIANAILNYERALKLKPFDKDYQYNLELTQQYTVDKVDVVDEFFMVKGLKAFRQKLTSDSWAKLSMTLFSVFVLCMLIFSFTGKISLKRISFYLGMLVLLGVFISVWAAAAEKRDISTVEEAIVFSPSVTIKGSPDDSGTDLFILHEGAKVTLKDSVGEWRRIEMQDGNVGWLQKDDIEKI